MYTTSERGNPVRAKLFLIFGTLCALFIFSMFYRVTNAVIAPDLLRDLGLNAGTLGVLGGAFFYSFALLQLPMGVLLDRVGPRTIIPLFSVIGAAGALIFGLAESFATAMLGRILIGIGMASVLMGTLKVFVLRFPQGQFATLAGITISIGTLGNILATSPLAYLNATIGWRHTFLYAAVITFLLAFSLWWILKEQTNPGKDNHHDEQSSHGEISISRSIRLIVKSLSFWQICSVAFFRYGTFVALQGLWFGPFLMDIEGYNPVRTGNILLALSIGMVLGAPVSGRLADRVFGKTKTVILLGLTLYTLTLLPLTGVVSVGSPLAYTVLFFFMGFFSGFGSLTYTHGKELFPLNISATVIAGVNFFTIAGGAVFMQVLGQLIETLTRGSEGAESAAYRSAFLLCFLGMAASILFYAFAKSMAKARGTT